MGFLKKLFSWFSSKKEPEKKPEEKTEEKQQVTVPSREAATDPSFDTSPRPVEKKDKPWVYPYNTSYIADPDGGKRLLSTKNNKPLGVVIHHTATYKLTPTVNYFKKNVVDVHFVVGHDGSVVQMVQLNRTAAHAGKSSWNGMSSLNNYFIGIEVINIGWLTKKNGKFYDGYRREWKGKVRERHILGYKYWEPFTQAQETRLKEICLWLVKTYDIPVHNITAHFEVSPGRKNDPAGGMSMSMDQFRSEIARDLKKS